MDTACNWIWQQANWPQFEWQDDVTTPLIRDIRLKQGTLFGRATCINAELNPSKVLHVLQTNIICSAAVDKLQLDSATLETSLAKRLGLSISSAAAISSHSESLAEALLDAVDNIEAPLTLERLLQWQQNLMPEQGSSLRNKKPLSTDPITKPEQPAPPGVILELCGFIDWFNQSRSNCRLDPLIRAAISLFWLETLQPFDQGNGLISRLVTDHSLSQADNQSIRLYAMSETIQSNNAEYQKKLLHSKQGDLDLTLWIEYFLTLLDRSLNGALLQLRREQDKINFWQQFQTAGLYREQVEILRHLLKNSDNPATEAISAAQYQQLTQVSKATATRHLADLLDKGCIEKLPGGGRSTRYQVKLSDNHTIQETVGLLADKK